MSLSPVVIDYETLDSRGSSTDFYRRDFKIDSIALTWEQGGSLKSIFYDTPDMITRILKRLDKTQRPIIVHNLQFEMGVTMALYPKLNLNWQYDTMRQSLLRDGGGDAKLLAKAKTSVGALLGTSAKTRMGLGLEKCASRFLPPEYQNHKKEAHDWLEENLGIKTKHGSHLHKLPRDILEHYNTGDTEVTYRLWQENVRYFKEADYTDRVDWGLYRMKCKLFCDAKLWGFPVDREGLLQYIIDIDKQIADINNEFINYLGPAIPEFENDLIWKDVKKKVKLEKNWEKAYKTRKKSGRFKFNPNSRDQLSGILMDYFDIKPVKFTKGNAPSTAEADLWQWGEAGKILERKGKMKINLNQAMGMYLASEYDGILHPDVKGASTATNRARGGTDV